MDIERLRTLGQEWQKGNHHRIYINDLPTLYGLQVSRYKTGNISSASLNGESLSNTKANHLLTSLELGKLWYDVTQERWFHQGMSDNMSDILIEVIEAKL